MPNRLANSSSPYLRQHAENPVDWFEWGEEAHAAARSLDCPILLSVGYSACHWCHVMAHESFEDDEVAAFANDHFVCVKVDREERPDVDDTYMTAVQLSSGRGGWPMTVFLTPELKPFFAGTYFPKNDRGQFPGFLTVLRHLAHSWSNDRANVDQAAESLAGAVADALDRPTPPGELTEELLHQAVEALAETFDPEHGGFGGAPKFPPHSALKFLQAYEQAYSAHRAGDLARRTLKGMVDGGLFDRIGGGMHRYSTDGAWRLPHFEKMLYDNVLALTYLPPGPEVEGVFACLAADFRREDGLFGSARDADSEGEEGRFYLWKVSEVREALDQDAERFLSAYDFSEEGNYLDEATGERTGLNLVFGDRTDNCEDLFPKLNARRRATREHPGFDEKAITAWNALAALGFHNQGHTEEACDLLKKLGDQNLKRVIGGEQKGFLEDFAAVALARLTCGLEANHILDELENRFAAPTGGFFATEDGHEKLLGRTKPVFDNPVPSGNSLAIRALIKGGRYDRAKAHLEALAGWMAVAPTACEGLLLAYLELLQATNFAEDFSITAIRTGRMVTVSFSLRHDESVQQVTLNGVEQPDEGPYLSETLSPEITVRFVRCRDFLCGLPETRHVTVTGA